MATVAFVLFFTIKEAAQGKNNKEKKCPLITAHIKKRVQKIGQKRAQFRRRNWSVQSSEYFPVSHAQIYIEKSIVYGFKTNFNWISC